MARANFRLQEGIEIGETNGTGAVWILRDTGAPPGSSGKSDDAPIGSLWLREDNTGQTYHKIADTSSASDWAVFADEVTSDDDIAAATPTTVNTCLVDLCNNVEYEVFVYEQADETNRQSFKIATLHNGETGADATLIDEAVFAERSFPAQKIAGLTFTALLAGATTTQTIGLQISATAAITVLTRRTTQAAA